MVILREEVFVVTGHSLTRWLDITSLAFFIQKRKTLSMNGTWVMTSVITVFLVLVVGDLKPILASISSNAK
jgi:hypothetical protein